MDTKQITEFFSKLSVEKLLPCLVIFAVGLVVVRLLSKLFDRALAHSKLDHTIHTFLRSVVRVLLYIILILILISYLGMDTSSLIAVLSVVTLAISLAVQNVLANVVGGLALLTAHPFKAGDFVEIASYSGTVQEVGLFYTKLLTVDHKYVDIPNSNVTAKEVINYTAEGVRRVDFKIDVSYDCETEAVKAALLEAANVPTALFTPEPFASIDNYGDHAIRYVLQVWTASENYFPTYYAVMEKIRVVFAECKLEMTYPHLLVHLQEN